jgi:hypothetical protein
MPEEIVHNLVNSMDEETLKLFDEEEGKGIY